jgi:hypothetical protein
VADLVAVAVKRARAEQRLRTAVDRLARSVGVEFVPPSVPANRFPDLYTAQLVECVATFLERLGDNLPKPERKSR